MLYSRAGDYPRHQPLLYAESFSPNTPEGACPECHGLGRIYEVTEDSMVPDPSLTIRDRAIAAWPPAWQGQNQRDILTTLGYDVDKPWRDLPKKDRDWILFTEEQPVVPVYAGFTRAEVKQALKRKEEPSYMGTFTSARRYVLHTFAITESAMMKKRVARFMRSTECPLCRGKRLRRESLSVKFSGYDIAELSRQTLEHLAQIMHPYVTSANEKLAKQHPEKAEVIRRIAHDLCSRLEVLLDLGLGYLALERSTPTLSPGELQRLRLATQVRSNLFGVVYVLDEPSAGLHPADTEALLRALDRLKASGNSLFVVEHDLDVVRRADWIVDVGPAAGQHGGDILFSGPPGELRRVRNSQTRRYIFDPPALPEREPRTPNHWLELKGVTRNNLQNLSVRFPIGVFTSVTGVSGSGKSSLVSQALIELVADKLGHSFETEVEETDTLGREAVTKSEGKIVAGLEHIKRLVVVDQKAIGRTPRSNLATYTGLFDNVRNLFASTPEAKARRYGAGRFSFNVASGRCDNCKGEGFVMVELLFLPSVYTPCPACHGARYNPKTLEIRYRGKNIAEVLALTVDEAYAFFAADPPTRRALHVLHEVGLGYLRLGQPATELSGGEAQRIKLATELQRNQRGNTLYVLDEPTTGLHPADVERLVAQLSGLVDSGNTVIVVEHDMRVVAAADWVIDIGPGAGERGGRIVVEGPPDKVARSHESRTARYLAAFLSDASRTQPSILKPLEERTA
jgi:excinuclease ABC subunit A